MSIANKWKVTSWQVMPELRQPAAGYIASHDLTYTKVFNAFLLALLSGDIKIKAPAGIRIMKNEMNPIEEILKVQLYSRAGELLNPNPLTKLKGVKGDEL